MPVTSTQSDTIQGTLDGPPSGNTLAIWSDGTTLYLAIDNAWVRAYDAESGPPHTGAGLQNKSPP